VPTEIHWTRHIPRCLGVQLAQLRVTLELLFPVAFPHRVHFVAVLLLQLECTLEGAGMQLLRALTAGQQRLPIRVTVGAA